MTVCLFIPFLFLVVLVLSFYFLRPLSLSLSLSLSLGILFMKDMTRGLCQKRNERGKRTSNHRQPNRIQLESSHRFFFSFYSSLSLSLSLSVFFSFSLLFFLSPFSYTNTDTHTRACNQPSSVFVVDVCACCLLLPSHASQSNVELACSTS
jgi:hypothetical protein